MSLVPAPAINVAASVLDTTDDFLRMGPIPTGWYMTKLRARVHAIMAEEWSLGAAIVTTAAETEQAYQAGANIFNNIKNLATVNEPIRGGTGAEETTEIEIYIGRRSTNPTTYLLLRCVAVSGGNTIFLSASLELLQPDPDLIL